MPMGMWQRSHGTSSITVTRGAPAWAVSVRLGQPAEELGLQLQHNPFTGNLQAAKLHLQQGGMKTLKKEHNRGSLETRVFQSWETG